MSWNVINLDFIAPAPWKNGGGTTRELVAWPSANDWKWRMSVAEVAKSGSFSRFEGVKRWFAMVSGAGVKLRTQCVVHTLDSSSEPICFDGAADTDCNLIDGTTLDFNLMVRGDSISAKMVRVNEPIDFRVSDASTVAIFIMTTKATIEYNASSADIEPGNLIWRDVKSGDQIKIGASSAFLITLADRQRS